MRTSIKAAVCAGFMMLVVATAGADWFPGEDHKMHFPQMPDTDGWDVKGTTPSILADNWQCSESGPVTDFHIWGSWEGGLTGSITEVRVSIHENVPADPTDPTSFNQPGSLLWAQAFDSAGFVMLDPWGFGVQGWYDPTTGNVKTNDHDTFHQINIENINNPFVQTFGEVYWLNFSVSLDPAIGGTWGWKTADLDQYPAPYTGNTFMGDAVWSAPGAGWQQLHDPLTGSSMDLAFVITPEPASLVLLVGAGLVLVRSRRGRLLAS